MPARPRIAALIAVLALAAPAAALAQSEPGAGDSQYSDPFAPQSSQPAQTQTQIQTQTAPQPTPDHEGGDQAGDEPQLGVAEPEIRKTPVQSAPAQTLPRTGFDVLPLAAAGVALLLAGLALWRRPHARR